MTTSVIERASTSIPASLGNVRAERAAPDDSEISYRISCPCGGAVGTITSEHAETDDFWRDPIVFTCVDCGRSATVFDSSKHGYDAVLNGFSSYEQRTKDEQVSCPSCGGRRHELLGSYRYDLEEEDIQDLSEDERARVSDLFTGVGFRLTCADCGEVRWLANFECA